MASKQKRPRTPAQEAAAERNLQKGNPKSYSRRSAEEAPPKTPDSIEEVPSKDTYRARAASRKPSKAAQGRSEGASRKTTAKPRSAPREAPRAPRGSSGGFWSGLLEGLGG
jgi:hypothetical protein